LWSAFVTVVYRLFLRSYSHSTGLAEFVVYTGDFEAGNFHGGEKTVGRKVLRAH
jgi:hypothetical protein